MAKQEKYDKKWVKVVWSGAKKVARSISKESRLYGFGNMVSLLFYRS